MSTHIFALFLALPNITALEILVITFLILKQAIFAECSSFLEMHSLRTKSGFSHSSSVALFELNPTFKKILAMVQWCLTYHIISRFTVLEEAEQY